MADMMPANVSSPSSVAEQVVDPRQQILQFASEVFERAPDWVTFYREVLGVQGIVRRMFRNAPPEVLRDFERSAEHARLQRMLGLLRERKEESTQEMEPTRVITVRLPRSVHESLKAEAYDRRTSMNRLCISKLLQMIDTLPSQ